MKKWKVFILNFKREINDKNIFQIYIAINYIS